VTFIPIKLVRDDVALRPAVARARPSYDKPQRAVGIKLLRRKLVEKALEYLENPSLEELVELYEVVTALAHMDLTVTMKELESAVVLKRAQRGGFANLMVLGIET
jgi:predicted house-cleaning noncanonical NTP pyrophosphatase (MazG superfamily)